MKVLLLAVCVACAPAATPSPQASAPKPSGCREDMADCAAACALRETARAQYVEWFDRRCAAAILGKDPDVVAGANPPPLKAELLDTR